MKKVVLICFLLLCIFPSTVSAHILETDGSIGAVLHIDPEDDPIAGEKANIHLSFKDKDNLLQPILGSCLLIVLRDNHEVFREELFDSNNHHGVLNDIHTEYVFPSIGVYTIVLEGKPHREGGFQPFKLEYDIRVSRDSGNIASAVDSSSTIYVLIACIVGSLVIIFLCKRKASKS